MSRLPVNSFSTLDLTHYIETGEHLPPIRGDACPMPIEFYIKKTREKQSRARLWTHLNERIKDNNLSEVKPGIIEGKAYNKAQRVQQNIHLFMDDTDILVLTPDGSLLLVPSPKECSKPPTLKAPWE